MVLEVISVLEMESATRPAENITAFPPIKPLQRWKS
jgi:hypothetical protein